MTWSTTPLAGADFLTVAFAFSVLAYGAATVILTCWHATTARFARPLSLLFGYGSAWAIALVLGSPVLVASVALACGAASAGIAGRRVRDLSGPGVLSVCTFVQTLVVTLPWGLRFLAELPVDAVTRGLLFAGYALALLSLPVGLVHVYEAGEVLWRTTWRRPRAALAAAWRTRYPLVSIHVPTHAEPPWVVNATLDALAGLDYPNFEVLVVDNNTADPNLWRPVEVHCLSLGPRFRFFHVEGLAGAKAGALNLALRHTNPAAEVVGVVDADYQVASDFVDRLIGYFDDPKMGFVQTPHDYRGWEHSRYLRACYWEYRYFYRTILVSRNERGAALTVGTMCLIRRAALEDAGGWAEWCVTEDSELAIRIHALGYASVYLTESFGKGLIPETFAGYSRQRFRWTYGPVQELKHHVQLLLPRPLAEPSRLRPAQKIHHLNHGLDRAAMGTNFLLMPLGAAVAVSMIVHGDKIPVPFALWLAITVLLVSGVVFRLLLYRVVIGCSVRETAEAFVASKALSHTVAMASICGIFTRTMPWRRTDKFPAKASPGRALRSSRVELAVGASLLGAAVALLLTSPWGTLLSMVAVGGILLALRYFCSPTLALLAESELSRAERAGRREPPAHGPKVRRLGVGRIVVGAAAAALLLAGTVLAVRLIDYSRPQVRAATAGAPRAVREPVISTQVGPPNATRTTPHPGREPKGMASSPADPFRPKPSIAPGGNISAAHAIAPWGSSALPTPSPPIGPPVRWAFTPRTGTVAWAASWVMADPSGICPEAPTHLVVFPRGC